MEFCSTGQILKVVTIPQMAATRYRPDVLLRILQAKCEIDSAYRLNRPLGRSVNLTTPWDF